MELIRLALSIVAGAIIGYGTNWFAILLIFRFLIPRRKPEIAESVQKLVKDLMPAERLQERLSSAKTRQALRELLDTFLEQHLARKEPLRVALGDSLAVSRFIGEQKSAILSELFAWLSSEPFQRDVLTPFIEQQVADYKRRSPRQSVPALCEAVIGNLSPAASRFLQNDGTHAWVARLLDGMLRKAARERRTLEDLISTDVADAIATAARGQAPAIIPLIERELRDPDLQATLTRVVTAAVTEQISKMGPVPRTMSAFVDVDAQVGKIVRQLPTHVERALQDADVRERVEATLERLVREFLEQDVGELLRTLGDGREGLPLEAVVRALLDPHTCEAVARAVSEYVDGLLDRSVAELSIKFSVPLDEKKLAGSLAVHLQALIMSDEASALAAAKVDEVVDAILAQPVEKLGKRVSREMRDSFLDWGVGEITNALASHIEEFAEKAGIWDVVGESVRKYPDREIEKMIRRIANKELVQINRIGGVVGGIIGVLQWLLSLLSTRWLTP